MLGFALNSKRLKDRLMDSSSLVGEVNTEWARTMNKIVFDAACKRGSSGCAASLMELTGMPPQVRHSRQIGEGNAVWHVSLSSLTSTQTQGRRFR